MNNTCRLEELLNKEIKESVYLESLYAKTIKEESMWDNRKPSSYSIYEAAYAVGWEVTSEYFTALGFDVAAEVFQIISPDQDKRILEAVCLNVENVSKEEIDFVLIGIKAYYKFANEYKLHRKLKKLLKGDKIVEAYYIL